MTILKSIMKKYYQESCNNRKYLILYLFLISALFLSMMNIGNYLHPIGEFTVFILMVLFGCFIIDYHTLHKEELYKTAFITIIVFGVLFSILTPIFLVADESEHFARALLTSTGNFFPHFDKTNNGFLTFKLVEDMVIFTRSNFFTPQTYNLPINYSPVYFNSAFQQNPFFGYLAPAFGILVAELFHLPAIGTLLLGRLCNVILYAVCISIVIRKTPVLKIPMFVIACMPLALFQAASVSIDVLINGLAFIIIAYFLYLLKGDVEIGKKELVIFSALVCLTSLAKSPFLAFFLLIFLIPKDKFQKNYFYYAIGIFVLVMGIVISYNKFYAVPSLANSVRSVYFADSNVNSTLQLSYLLSHIPQTLIMIFQMPKYLYVTITDLNTLSWGENRFGSLLINTMYTLFLGALWLLYPIKTKLSKKVRIGNLFIISTIFIGTYLILLLTWTPVGDLTNIVGVQSRYFIPLFLLAILSFNFSNKTPNYQRIKKLFFVLAIVFLAASILLTTIRWY